VGKQPTHRSYTDTYKPNKMKGVCHFEGMPKPVLFSIGLLTAQFIIGFHLAYAGSSAAQPMAGKVVSDVLSHCPPLVLYIKNRTECTIMHAIPKV